MVDLEKTGIKLPNDLLGDYLWLVGPDESRPDVIFIGRANFKGIIVTKNDYYESMGMLKDWEVPSTEHKYDRLGIICVNRD